MIKITHKRVKGFGKGTEIGFPTINFLVDDLHPDLSEGLWVGVTQKGRSISLISKYIGGWRIETNIIEKRYPFIINVNESFTITILSRLRLPKKIKDIKLSIKEDIDLAENFFKTAKTCYSCKLFYTQDYGYSNYTVEGSSIGCYANMFEEIDAEQDLGLSYTATDCINMIDGDPWSFDVDGECDGPSDEWKKSVLRDVKINQILK